MSVQERVEQERDELRAKLDALVAFIGTEPYMELDLRHRELLRMQSDLMVRYLGVLEHRINLWEMDVE